MPSYRTEQADDTLNEHVTRPKFRSRQLSTRVAGKSSAKERFAIASSLLTTPAKASRDSDMLTCWLPVRLCALRMAKCRRQREPHEILADVQLSAPRSRACASVGTVVQGDCRLIADVHRSYHRASAIAIHHRQLQSLATVTVYRVPTRLAFSHSRLSVAAHKRLTCIY